MPPSGAEDERVGMDLIDDADLIDVYFDRVDQQLEQGAFGGEVGLFQSIGDLSSEQIELVDDEPKLLFARRVALRLSLRVFLALQALLDAAHSQREFVLVQQSVFIYVDQPSQPAF